MGKVEGRFGRFFGYHFCYYVGLGSECCEIGPEER